MTSFQAVILGTCLALTGTAHSVPPHAEQLYIAVDGNDAWTGRLPSPNHQGTDGPFASFSRAREAVRELRKMRPEVPVTVNVRGGTYRLKETLALTAEDSGSAEAPVTWRAMPSETVRVVGGARLSGFARVTDEAVLERLNPSARDSVVQVNLAACGVRDFGKPTPVGGRQAELVCNSRYMQLARYPNEGEWLRITHIPEGETRIETEYDSHYGRFGYPGDRPRRWKDVSDLWVHGYWVYDWSTQYHRVQTLDLEKREIAPEPPYHHYGYRQGQRFYFLNVLEELDAPGEWFLDRNTGLLYFWPPCPLEGAEVFFPELEVPMVTLTGVEHVRICGITFECSREMAIVMEGGTGNEVAGCTVRNIGAVAAVAIGGTNNGMRSCDVYELAGMGIVLDGGDRATLTPGGNYVINCEIHHPGHVYRTYHGPFSLRGVGNRIAHCWVHDVPHQAIGYYGNDHIIEYCEFERIATETGDVGVIYSGADWTYMGHEVRYNYFHNVHAPGQLGCFTIYPDLPCGGIHLHHNVFYDVDQGFYTNSGRGMVIDNNIFLRCGKTAGFGVWRDDSMFLEGGAWRMVENLMAVGYDRPPYSERYPVLRQLAADFALGPEHILQRQLPKDNIIRRNVSWGGLFLHLDPLASLEHVRVEKNLIADDIVFTGCFEGSGTAKTYHNGDETIAAKLGERGNIIVAGDPGFGDLQTQDFRLSPDSKAWQLGFEPIPFERIGLYTDEYRQRLPLAVSDPIIEPSSRSFTSDVVVQVIPTPRPGGARCTLHYTLDGTEPTLESPEYTQPLRISETTVVKAAAFATDGKEVVRSTTVSAMYRALRLAEGAVYLSDLPEQGVFAYPGCWVKDANHLGGPIRVGGVQYAKGILLHPDKTQDGPGVGWVVYALDGDLRKATRFRAVIGIDDEMKTHNLGSAGFIVEVRRNGEWQRVYESPVLRLGDAPVEVNVDISGAEQLRLITTDAEDGIACDHAVWADARLE